MKIPYMNKLIRNITLLFFSLLFFYTGKGEILKVVKWDFVAKKTAQNEYDLIFHAKIDKTWHFYSQCSSIENDAPYPLVFTFKTTKGYTKMGVVKEVTKVITKYDDIVKHDLKFFENDAVFVQHIKLTESISAVAGSLEFMACHDGGCLPPEDVDFNFKVTFENAGAATHVKDANETKPASEAKVVATNDSKETNKVATNTTVIKPQTEEIKTASKPKGVSGSLWQIFWAGFLGGLLAILTPCVFPMIPLTVSFFTKKKHDHINNGIGKALLFGLSIILIYVGIGFIITKIFGANALNSMASNVYFNLAFFAIFFVFALSFLGAFEITLPASWTNKADSQSEKGGLLGIFFMAFTLALVSFSCTGPIVGQLLVLAALGGGYAGPITGMFGFSFALALPFTLFAIFPSWMQSLPKSGGWLNSVKVTLGFVELALSLKFLSVVDLTYHWDFLKREYFLALWIIIFALLGLYLIGKIKFSHDSDLPYISIPRLLLAILSFGFAVYIVPGLWGAPVNLLSGIAPPNEYTEGAFTGGNSVAVAEAPTKNSGIGRKYGEHFKCPFSLDCYFDYDEALTASRKEHKPLMIDFTGHACVNCRKMENTVWHNPDVLARLKNDYILVSLYVDDKTDLDPKEVYTSKSSGNQINYLGAKWSDIQASRFETNSQPYYVLLDQNEKLLNEPQGYDPSIEKFVNFLEKGKQEYKKRQ